MDHMRTSIYAHTAGTPQNAHTPIHTHPPYAYAHAPSRFICTRHAHTAGRHTTKHIPTPVHEHGALLGVLVDEVHAPRKLAQEVLLRQVVNLNSQVRVHALHGDRVAQERQHRAHTMLGEHLGPDAVDPARCT